MIPVDYCIKSNDFVNFIQTIWRLAMDYVNPIILYGISGGKCSLGLFIYRLNSKGIFVIVYVHNHRQVSF